MVYTFYFVKNSNDRLLQIARNYVWWKDPNEFFKNESYFLGHMMNLATWDDAMVVFETLGEDAFIKALAKAPAGMMNKKSWNFWHLWLGLSVPGYPERKVG